MRRIFLLILAVVTFAMGAVADDNSPAQTPTSNTSCSATLSSSCEQVVNLARNSSHSRWT